MPSNHQGLRRAFSRPAAACAALALAGSGLLATATPAAAADPKPTALTISPAKVVKTVGQEASLLFTLTTGGSRLARQPIAIYVKPAGSTTWTRKWAPVLNAYGQVRITYTVSRTLYVKAKFGGNETYARSVSNTAYVGASSAFPQRLMEEAARHRGKPYQWGAVGPHRFDCSGFTLYVYGRFGKSLPHNSRQQYAVSRKVAKSEKRVGDLIFTYNSSGIHHVAIYAGNGYIWHSPRSGDVVKHSKMWSNSYYVGRVA